MDIETYIKERVDDQLSYYASAASRAKQHHVRTQSVIIFLGVLVPVVVNLPESWFGFVDDTPIQVAVTVLSLTLAILTGIVNFRKYGELWLTYRTTEEMLKHEKYMYLTRSGGYASIEKPERIFVQKIEAIIADEHGHFRNLVEDANKGKAQITSPPPTA